MDNIEKIGVITPFIGNEPPYVWIVCDGLQYNNDNGNFNQLIKLGIGNSLNGNIYIPPNNENMKLITDSEFDIEIANKTHIKYFGHSHKFDNNNELQNYFLIPKPIFLNKNKKFINWFDSCYKINTASDSKIRWIIKY